MRQQASDRSGTEGFESSNVYFPGNSTATHPMLAFLQKENVLSCFR